MLVCGLLLLVAVSTHAGLPSVISIGAVLSGHKEGQIFQKAVMNYNGKADSPLPASVTLNATYIPMDTNPIRASKAICEDLIPHQVYVVIAGHPRQTQLSPMAVSFTCGYYKIPVIGISTRESSFSDKNVHSSFMRTVPPYSQQAEVWVAMVKFFGFQRVIFMHSSDQEGRAMLGKFQSRAETEDIEIEKNVQYISGYDNYTEELLQLPGLSSRVVLLFAAEDDAATIYRDAIRLNLTGAGYAWFVTEQALRPANTPKGAVGLRLIDAENEEAHIEDSVQLIVKALARLDESGDNVTEAPNHCSDASNPWNSGDLIFKYLKEEEILHGRTGRVMFNDNGDRINAIYQIVNLKSTGTAVIGIYDPFKSMEDDVKRLEIRDPNIVWPGNQPVKPKGIKISTHLQVVTIEALPFIYADPMEKTGGKCEPELNKVPCPRPNTTEGTRKEFCCYGYAIDLLIELSKEVNFTYELHLVEDNNFGTFERHNQSSKRNGSGKTWNGMIGELTTGTADLIVAPLTVDPERAEHIDFSKPFKYQGLTILVRKTIKDSSLASFLQPFQDTLWILVGLSVHVVGLVLYLLDRFSPFGRYKLAKSDDTEEDALNLSSAMWFAWGVLLNSGIGEGTPRSFSARVLGMVWAGFAMIIVASYTANLAAFLVLDRPEASISGIDDARLRNPQENFKYATVKNSAVAMYFKRQVELSTMYRTMEGQNLESAEEAIQRVRDGKLHAFIWDSSRLEYEAANDCDLVTAGELFGRSGYGIGLVKGSPWTQMISLKILNFHERGYMEQLDNKWILVKDTKCPEKDTSPATLGLTNMAGVFMMVAGGIVMGVILIFIEIAYKRHRGLKEKELELAKTAADRWRGNIERRKMLRQSWLYLRNEKMAGGSPGATAASVNETSNPPAYTSPATAGAEQGYKWHNGQSQSCSPREQTQGEQPFWLPASSH